MSHWVISQTWWRSVLPFVKMLDFAQKPTCGQLDDGMTAMFSKDWRPDNGMLHVGHEEYSVSIEMGQGELMGFIRCTQIPFILVATNQSHLSPLSKTLLSQPTSRSIDPHRYWYCWIVLCHDSHNPLCLHIYVLCLALFFVTITSYRTFLS